MESRPAPVTGRGRLFDNGTLLLSLFSDLVYSYLSLWKRLVTTQSSTAFILK